MKTPEQFDDMSNRIYHALDLEWGKGWNHLSDKLRQALFVEAVIYHLMSKAAYKVEDIMDTLAVMISRFSPTAQANQELPPKEVAPKSSWTESKKLESATDWTVRQILIRLSSIRKILDDPHPSVFYLGVAMDIQDMAGKLRTFLSESPLTFKIVEPNLKSVTDALDGYDFQKLQAYKFSETAITSLMDDLYGVAAALHKMSGDQP